ncbi:hypothetical protein ACP4OV_030454 [Aristida adscensionis]
MQFTLCVVVSSTFQLGGGWQTGKRHILRELSQKTMQTNHDLILNEAVTEADLSSE